MLNYYGKRMKRSPKSYGKSKRRGSKKGKR